MIRSYVHVGVVAGLIVGVALSLFAVGVFSPMIESFEEDGHAHTGGHSGGDTHTGEHSEGLPFGQTAMTALGTIAWAISLGVLTAVGFYFSEPYLAGLRRELRGVAVGVAGFAAFGAVPWLVSPPVAPSVHQSLSAGSRVTWYWAVVVVTAATLMSTPFVYGRLRQRYGSDARYALVLLALVPASAVVAAPSNSFTLSSHELVYTATVAVGQFAVWIALGVLVARYAGVSLEATTEPVAESSK